MQASGPLVGLEHGQRQQLVGWGRRERGILLGGQGAQAVPGLRGDDDPEVSPGGVDDTGDLAKPRGRLDQRLQRLARGHIHGGGGHLEPGVAHHLGRRVDVALVQVRHQDVFAGADPPGDGLTNRPGSDDDGDLAHGDLLRRSCGWVAGAQLTRDDMGRKFLASR
jgi:hypothetical protein